MLPLAAPPDRPQARRQPPKKKADATPAADKPAEDNRPIDERLGKIGDHLRKNAVSKNYGSDASLKVADNIFSKYVESSKKQDDMLKRASEDQKDVLESLSASMIRFRKDDKADVKKFREEMLAVLTSAHAADGDEGVKQYVEDAIKGALKDSEKTNGFDGAIHKFMTKDSEKNKDSWLFKKIAGTETVDKATEIAKNDGIAINEQDKLNDHIHKGTDRTETNPMGKLENLIADLTSAIKGLKFPSTIDVLNVNKLVVDKKDKAKNKAKAQAAPADDERVKNKGAAPVHPKVSADDLIMTRPDPSPSVFKKTKGDIEDVDFREVKSTPMISRKTHALTYEPPKSADTIPDASVKPKYQGKLRTQETTMASAVRSAMNVGGKPSIPQKMVAAAPLVASVVPHDDLTKPVMNKFDAQEDLSSTSFGEKKTESSAVGPKEKEDESGSVVGDLLDNIPDVGGRGRGRARVKKAPMKGKGMGRFLKGAGKGLAVLGAGAAVYGGVKDIAAGNKIENVSDIVPKGGLLDKLNPAEYAMNAGRYTGDKVNKGYEGVSKMFGGSGSMGSDLYDLVNKPKAATVTPLPKAIQKPNVSGDQVAKTSAKVKDNSSPAATQPVVIHAPAAPAAAPKSTGAQPAVVSGTPRNRESYFDQQMIRIFAGL